MAEPRRLLSAARRQSRADGDARRPDPIGGGVVSGGRTPRQPLSNEASPISSGRLHLSATPEDTAPSQWRPSDRADRRRPTTPCGESDPPRRSHWIVWHLRRGLSIARAVKRGQDVRWSIRAAPRYVPAPSRRRLAKRVRTVLVGRPSRLSRGSSSDRTSRSRSTSESGVANGCTAT
jgi:hypothetical protein